MAEERVTLRDVYDAINRVESKYDRRLERIEQDIDQIKSFQNKAYGVVGMLSMFVSAAASYVWNKVVNN